MPAEPVIATFTYDDRGEVVDAVRSLGDGSGWVNVVPDVDPDDVPPQGGFSLFSTRGPVVPLGTVSPSGPVKRGSPHTSVGMLHGTGRKLVPMLAEVGVAIDAGWRVVQDHPRRGLVVEVPGDADADVVLAWVLDLADGLCPVPFNRWVAEVHRRR